MIDHEMACFPMLDVVEGSDGGDFREKQREKERGEERKGKEDNGCA